MLICCLLPNASSSLHCHRTVNWLTTCRRCHQQRVSPLQPPHFAAVGTRSDGKNGKSNSFGGVVPSMALSTMDTQQQSLDRKDLSKLRALLDDNFRPDIAGRRYLWDGLASREWLLVYNFRVGSVLFSIGRYAVALIAVFVAIAVDDFVRVGGGKFTIPSYQKLHSQLLAHGLIGKIVVFIAFLVFCSLARLRSLHMSRLYVHRTQPNRICANIASGLLSKKLVELDRSQIRVVPLSMKLHEIEPGWGSVRAMFKYIFFFLLHADVRLGKHGAQMINADGFRTHMLRNWTLNEHDVVPKRELRHLDIDVEKRDAEWRRNLRWWQKVFSFLDRPYFKK
uniref:Autophagy-related protein 9 n=1 Tax=Globodera pallida TaxID=36090 RepID=A0A183CK74_GLOPA